MPSVSCFGHSGESLSSYTVTFVNSQTLGIIPNMWNIIEG